MKKIKLDKEERELLHDIESGSFRSVRNSKKEIERMRKYARVTLKKIESDIKEGKNLSQPFSSAEEVKRHLESL